MFYVYFMYTMFYVNIYVYIYIYIYIYILCLFISCGAVSFIYLTNFWEDYKLGSVVGGGGNVVL